MVRLILILCVVEKIYVLFFHQQYENYLYLICYRRILESLKFFKYVINRIYEHVKHTSKFQLLIFMIFEIVKDVLLKMVDC